MWVPPIDKKSSPSHDRNHTQIIIPVQSSSSSVKSGSIGFLITALPSQLCRRHLMVPPWRTLSSMDARRRVWLRQATWMKHAAQVRHWWE
jgi:hypothetical protein